MNGEDTIRVQSWLIKILKKPYMEFNTENQQQQYPVVQSYSVHRRQSIYYQQSKGKGGGVFTVKVSKKAFTVQSKSALIPKTKGVSC